MSWRIPRDEALAALTAAPDGCAMCALADPARDPHHVVAACDDAVVRLDLYGSTHGHLLVVLRGHETRIEALAWTRYEALQRAAWRASRALARALAPRRVWVASLGAPEALPMSFPHAHLHVVPIHEGGEAARPARVLSWSSGVVVYGDEEARTLVDSLREAWPS